MSGGTFDYKQYILEQIADEIEERINRNGKLKYKKDLWMSKAFYENYPEEKYYEKYSDEAISELKAIIASLRVCKGFVDAADRLFASDDGEEIFHNKLKEMAKNVKFK